MKKYEFMDVEMTDDATMFLINLLNDHPKFLSVIDEIYVCPEFNPTRTADFWYSGLVFTLEAYGMTLRCNAIGDQEYIINIKDLDLFKIEYDTLYASNPDYFEDCFKTGTPLVDSSGSIDHDDFAILFTDDAGLQKASFAKSLQFDCEANNWLIITSNTSNDLDSFTDDVEGDLIGALTGLLDDLDGYIHEHFTDEDDFITGEVAQNNQGDNEL
jgi:hypothetical protein